MTALLFNFFIFLGALFSAQGVCSSHMKYLGILRFPRPCSHLITSMGSRFPLVISNQEQQAVSGFFVFCFLFLVLFCFVLFCFVYLFLFLNNLKGTGWLWNIAINKTNYFKLLKRAMGRYVYLFIYLFLFFIANSFLLASVANP